MGEIRGEYWIADGSVEYADDDKNHETIAVNYYASKHIDEIIHVANKLGVSLQGMRLTSSGRFLVDSESPTEDAAAIRDRIISAIHSNEIEWNRTQGDVSYGFDAYLKNVLKTDSEEYGCIFGGCDGRLMVMKREGWIAVRSNNIEFFGYNDSKRKEIVSGIEEILDQEGEIPEEEEGSIELSLYDHKTKRSWDSTLDDLRGGRISAVTLPTTTYNRPLFVPTKGLNLAQRQSLSTSEARISFKEWLRTNRS